jgi:hypothetical protein
MDLDVTKMATALRTQACASLGVANIQDAANPQDVAALPSEVFAYSIGEGTIERGPAVLDHTAAFPVTFYYGKAFGDGTADTVALVRAKLDALANALAADVSAWTVTDNGNLVSCDPGSVEVGGGDAYSALFRETEAPYAAGSLTIVLTAIV